MSAPGLEPAQCHTAIGHASLLHYEDNVEMQPRTEAVEDFWEEKASCFLVANFSVLVKCCIGQMLCEQAPVYQGGY